MRHFRDWFRSSPPNLVEIRDAGQLDAIFALRTPTLIFKHSWLCGSSLRAHQAVLKFCAERPDVQVFMVSVLDARDTSALIEQVTGITHESPQVVALRNGAVFAHASHEAIGRFLHTAW